MRHPFPSAPTRPARGLAGLGLLLAASCGGGAPSSSVVAPAQPVPPTPPGPTLPDDSDRTPNRVRSVADALTGSERRVREVDEVDYASVHSPVAGLRYRARFVDGFPGLIEFILNNTGSGWQEKFLVQLPPTHPTQPVPLLMVCHKFGASHGDVLNTTFMAESQARGWYLVAPLGARQKHFGAQEFQINTRAVLDLVAQLFPIDRQRVYGVGFSMGAGALANYAARHLDPSGVRFAALCEHTGGVSLPHTWFHEPDDADLDDDLPQPGLNLEVPDILEDLFGGTPSAVPFAYLRASCIELDPITGQIANGTNLGRNLAHLPTLIWMANADPLGYLVTQTYAFDAHLQSQNAGHQLNVVNGGVHSWSTLDETFVCDWLAQRTLQTPSAGRTLASENGPWFHFHVEQGAGGTFTPFTWEIDTVTRSVQLLQTANLRRISIDAPGAGLVLSGPVSLRLATSDGTGDRVRLLGVTSPPIAVTRDGVAAGGVYDALTASYEITETNPAPHDWVITFP